MEGTYPLDATSTKAMTRTELRPHLASWNTLNELFQCDDGPSRAELLALLDMERKGKNRQYLINRITGRLATVELQMRRGGKL